MNVILSWATSGCGKHVDERSGFVDDGEIIDKLNIY